MLFDRACQSASERSCLTARSAPSALVWGGHHLWSKSHPRHRRSERCWSRQTQPQTTFLGTTDSAGDLSPDRTTPQPHPGPSMSRVTFAPQVPPTLHERRRASERPPWTPASVLRDGEVDRLEPICARFQQAVWRLGRQWHGVHRRPTPIKVCRLGVAAIPWHWHQQLAHTDVRSTHPFSDCRRRPIAARGGGARLPTPVGQWGGQRRGYRSNTYRGPLQAAGRGLEAHGASSVGARPGGSRSPGGGVLRGHIRVHNTTVALIPRPPRPWTPPTHPRGHAGRLSHRKCRLQRPSTPRSRIGRFSQKPHLRHVAVRARSSQLR